MAQVYLSLDSEIFKELFTEEGRDEAFAGLVSVILRERVAERFRETATKAVKVLEEGFNDVTAILSLPHSLRRRFRTTSGLECVNEELRREERVIRIFPNEQSLCRLLSALLMEIHEERQTGRVYLNLNKYLAGKAQPSDTALQLSAAS